MVSLNIIELNRAETVQARIEELNRLFVLVKIKEINEQDCVIMNFISKQFGNTAGLTIVGHSSGGYECAILLSTPWNKVDQRVSDYFKTKLKRGVLMCGVFDVTQLIPTIENDIIKLSWYDVIGQSSFLVQ